MNIVIADSDAIIGLVYTSDSLHKTRALHQPELAAEVLSSYSNLEDKIDSETFPIPVWN